MKYTLSLLLILTSCTSVSIAQRNAGIPDPDPEIERKTFILPPGFEVNLYAGDKLLNKPIQMNWDAKGRLWVATSETYPQILPGQKANDKIIILEDTNKDGVADKTTVFADGLLIPTGVLPDNNGGAFVANSTEILHYPASGKPKVLLSGFGTEDTHHIIHTFRWGMDGAFYFNQSIYIHSHVETAQGVKRLNGGGIWRYEPDTKKLDVFARGWVNSWGHVFDKYGQSIVTDGAGGEGINHAIPGAYYITAVGANRILHGMNPGSPKYCGVEVLSGRHIPEEWVGNVITNDFRGHRVCRFKLQDDGSTFISREQPELIKSNHPAFRPIDVKMGPDGAIYVADWYNPIIQHGEVDFRDPRRDHVHGRIWRITYKGRPLAVLPEFEKLKTEELIQLLKNPEAFTRDFAKQELVKRGNSAWPLPAEMRIVKDAGAFELEMAWLEQALKIERPVYGILCLKSPLPEVRAAALRIFSENGTNKKDKMEWLSKGAEDPHPRVRMEAVRGLAKLNTAEAAVAAMAALNHPTDATLEYALWQTMKELAHVWLPEFQAEKIIFGNNTKALAFALDAVGTADAAKPVLKLIQKGNLPPEREQELWQLVVKVGGPEEHKDALHHATTLKNNTYADALLAGILEATQLRKVTAAGGFMPDLTTLMNHPSPATATRAILLAGEWRVAQLLPDLMKVAQEPAGARSRAAIQAMSLFRKQEAEPLFIKLEKADLKPELKIALLSAWSRFDVTTACQKSVDYLTKAEPSENLNELFRTLFSKQNVPAAFATMLKDKALPADVAKLALRAAKATAPNAKDLANAITKAGNLTATKAYPTEVEVKAMAAEVLSNGSATRGEVVFRRKEMQCLTCHAIAGAGGLVGPDLTSIGASAPVDYLVESLLNPNKAVKEGYHAVKVTLLSGATIQGVPIKEAEGVLTLRDAEDKEVKVPLNQIDEKTQTRSLMPDGLVDPLTRRDVVDLVRFLSELGKVGGSYAPSTARVVRKWEAVDASGNNTNIMRRTRASAVADTQNEFTWSTVYARATGELALTDAPQFTVWNGTAAQSAVRFKLNATTAGKVKLKLNQDKGITGYVGATPFAVAKENVLDITNGEVWVTLLLDRTIATIDLKVELEDVAGSAARVTIVNGK